MQGSLNECECVTACDHVRQTPSTPTMVIQKRGGLSRKGKQACYECHYRVFIFIRAVYFSLLRVSLQGVHIYTCSLF
jgi:hypothetical protein